MLHSCCKRQPPPPHMQKGISPFVPIQQNHFQTSPAQSVTTTMRRTVAHYKANATAATTASTRSTRTTHRTATPKLNHHRHEPSHRVRIAHVMRMCKWSQCYAFTRICARALCIGVLPTTTRNFVRFLVRFVCFLCGFVGRCKQSRDYIFLLSSENRGCSYAEQTAKHGQ